MFRDTLWLRLLSGGAGMFLAIASILMAVVIPEVRTDRSPGATPGMAVRAFIDSAVIHALLGALLIAALVVSRRRLARKALLVTVGSLGLLLAMLPLLDAAFSYAGHIPAMLVTTVTLFACAGCDLVVAGLAFAAAFLQSGNPVKAAAK